MNWKSIIATALVTGIVTVLTGIVLYWWQSEKLELTYNSIQSIPFDDSSNLLFIQQIEIQNSGDKPIDDVVLAISFTDEIIEKSRIVIDNAISHKKESDTKSITLKIDSLNPNEGANISVLYKSDTSYSTGAAISLRGKGVTGKLIGSNKETDRKEPLVIALIAAYAGVLSFFLSTKRGRTMLPIIMKSLLSGRLAASDDQKYVIASALSMYGYPEKAKDYLNSSSDRQYWVEADLLAAEALNGDEKLRRDTIKILSTISEIPNIVPSSKAITLYNIARLLHVETPNGKESIEYLTLAKQIKESVVQERLSKDPIFLASPTSNKPEELIKNPQADS